MTVNDGTKYTRRKKTPKNMQIFLHVKSSAISTNLGIKFILPRREFAKANVLAACCAILHNNKNNFRW